MANLAEVLMECGKKRSRLDEAIQVIGALVSVHSAHKGGAICDPQS